MTATSFLDVLDRAQRGPIRKLNEWDTNVISTKANEKLEKYGLKGTCDRENPVNRDATLADAFWKAGFEMATEVGMFCTDTNRVIQFTEEELKAGLKDAPGEVPLGWGRDRIVIGNRRPEDKLPTATFLGPFATACSEELFVPITQAAAQYRSVDAICQGTLLKGYGRELMAGTPYELLQGYLEAVLTKEGVRRAGRPGMPIDSVCSEATGLGTYGAYGAIGGCNPMTDYVPVLAVSDLKTNYYLLNKVAFVLNHAGICIEGWHYSMIGGYAGGPEASVVSTNASTVLQAVVHRATIQAGQVFDFRNFSGSSRECLWANSVALQGQSRNTHLLVAGALNPIAGPSTEMLLYETAAASIQHASSGSSWVIGVRPRCGKHPDYVSGLESHFAGEVCKVSGGMKLDDANEIVKKLVAKYEGKLKDPPAGKSFAECTDIRTLKPSGEWLDIYHRVKSELMDMGVFP